MLLTAGAYLLGSIPTAYLVAKWTRGIDIRQYGSGNVGASNISAVVSKQWTVPVSIFDLGKGMLAVYAARALHLEEYQQTVVGLAAIAGHDWPVFLGFNGGRGILTTAGVLFVLAPWLTLATAAATLLFAPFHRMPLASLLALSAASFSSWFLPQAFGVERSAALTAAFAAVTVIVVIRRLAVRRTDLSASTPAGELITNRLLFDRDIRDREAWINRAPSKAKLRQEG
ncbi:MAG: glycerol-3-phosphate acyltransferase [Chloroflexi bacterium]|nr:glycerol-3-phosphate acyltransferase [Chloroflexota bacterium]